MILVPRLSSVDESHEPLSPPVTLEASTSYASNQESATSVHVEMDTSPANQETSSSVQTKEDSPTPQIVVTEMTSETTNQETVSEITPTSDMATGDQDTTINPETVTNITATDDTETANQEVQSSNVERVTINIEKTGQKGSRAFTIQPQPHRNVSLTRTEQEEIEARLTATL